MENSVGVGFVAAFAVSGSVVLIARQVHKRLLSDFMKRMEYELGGSSLKCDQSKKKVKFSEQVTEVPVSARKFRRRGKDKGLKIGDDSISMPVNRQILYKGILEYKTLTAQNFV